jgi:anti-sigma regulatory factor (Ser/Thr protein kinase)
MEQRAFANEPSSVSKARRFVTAQLKALPEPLVDSVTLMVSELSTNSIRHAHTGFTVEIAVTEDQVYVAVVDAGAGQPELREPQPDDPSGRGLRIVELLSDDWGVTPSTPQTGKTVWFKVNSKAPARPRTGSDRNPTKV